MKPVISLCLTLALSSICAGAQAAGGSDTAKGAFDLVKHLEGSWQGKDEEGQAATAKYEVMSGGTIVTETMQPGKEPPMLTVYHVDGDKFLCTHYCSRNNQPRMKLEKSDLKKGELDFDFLDVTNLTNSQDGHMRKLTLITPDKDHLEQVWSWMENGQSSQVVFKFERRK